MVSFWIRLNSCCLVETEFSVFRPSVQEVDDEQPPPPDTAGGGAITGEPEPMSEKDMREASAAIDVFGEPLVRIYLTLFPNKFWFLPLCRTNLMKTLWEKEKLLITSNFSFSHSVFYPFEELSATFIKSEIVVCKISQFGKFVVWERVNSLPDQKILDLLNEVVIQHMISIDF